MELLECRRVLATITVDSLADNTTADAFTTLREAITMANASADADTIVFDSSLFSGGAGTITLGSGLPTIAATSSAGTLTITGPGAATLTVTANNGNFRVFEVASGGNATLSGMTVTGVNSTGYGAIQNSGTLAVDDVTVSNNYAGIGAAGILSKTGSTLTVTNSVIANNTTPSYGGGLRVHGTTTITNTLIAGNAAGSEGGGGLYNFSGNVSISNSTIRGNRTGAGGGNNWGGGLASTGTMTINACEISENVAAGDGGGVYSNNVLTITNSTISGNRASGVGGGIINGRTLSVTQSTVADNTAAAGGGIYNSYISSWVTLTNTILGDNLGGDYGATFGTDTNSASANNLVTQGSFAWATTVTSSQLNLGVLQNNGGPTRTQALVTGSAAISSTVLGTPTLDQRGFTRTTADIGAFSYNYTGADGLVVSQNNEEQVVLTLPATASLSDVQVAYDSGANTVTITPVATGFTGATTFVPSGGIAGITAGTSGGNKTVVVDLATQTGFGGIAVVTTSGTGATTLSGAIDLSLITGGAANQSITLSTLGGAGSTSSLAFSNAITPKGSGSIALGAGSISGSATLVASSVTANAATGMTLATQATAFGRIGNLASGTTTISQTGAAVLSSVVVTGDLALTSTGAMTQAGVSVVSVTGSSVFDSGGAAVTLSSAANDFVGGVTVNSSASSVSLRDANALTITSLSLAANASVTAVAGTTLVMPAGGISTGTGNIELQALGSAFSPSGTLTTTSGSVSLYGGSGLTITNNITSTSGSISLTGPGVVVNAGVTVNAGSGTILVDGNDGSISLAGALTTTSNAGNAIVIQDATTVSLGTITTGGTGTLRLGYGDGYSDKDNGDRISGLVTQTGGITAGTLTGYVAAGATLTAANAISTISQLTSSRLSGNFTLSNTGGLLVNSFTNQWGNSTFATTGQLQFHSIATDLRSLSLTGVGVSASQSNSSIWSGNITVNGGAGAIAMGTRLALNGTLVLNNTGAFDVSANVRGDWPGDGWVRLGTSSIGGNLSLSGHGIVQSGILTVGGNATFTTNVSGYDIDLGSYANDLAGTVTVNSAGNLRDFKLRNVNTAAGAVTNLTNAAATQLRDLSIIYPNAAYALPSLRQSSLRNVVVSAGGAITQAGGGITPTGTSSFTTGGFAITLTDDANDFGGAVALTNTGANAVAITDVDDLQLAASSVGSGTLAVTAVGITQTGALTQAAGAAAATFTGGAGAIELTQPGNEFTGAVSLTTSGTNDASVTDATALILGTSSVGQNLAATATAFTQSGAITVAGTTTLTAAAAATDIDLATQANDLAGTVTVNTAANVRDFQLWNVSAAAGAITNLTDAAATSLRDLSILYGAAGYELPSLRQASLRNVVVSAGGAITQASGGITPTGTSSFTTGGFAITLTDDANDFGGAVALTNTGANAVAITDVDDLQLAASSVGSGTLAVTAVGITQTGAITQAAGALAATFSGGAGAIQLTQPGNEFTGAVSLTTTGTNDAEVTDATALILGTSSVGQNLAATATAFTQSGAITVAGTTTLTAAAAATDIDLATQANDLAGTVTVNTAANVRDFKLWNVSAAAGAVTNLTDAAATSLRDLSILYGATGYEVPSLRQASLRNVVVSAGGAITQATGGITPTGTASFTTGGFVITLTDDANDFGGAVSLANTGVNAIDVAAANAFSVSAVTTGGDVTVTAVGTITVGNAITAAGRTVTLDSTGGAVVGGGTITAGTVDLDAETGIGTTSALSLAAGSIAADSTSGPVRLANALATAVTVSSLTSKGASDPSGALLSFSQSGGGTVTFNTVSSAGSDDGYGVISLTNTGVGGGITVAGGSGSGVTSRTGSTITLQTTQGGSILVDTFIDANIGDGRVELFSDGSISVPGLITGGEALLQAQTGIDVNASMPSGFGAISSPSGNIRVINQFDIGVNNDISTSGDVTLIASYGIIVTRSIEATGSGKKITLTALGGDVQGSGLITANTVDLNATTGIGSTTALELEAFFVSADTTSGAIDIDNASDTAVSVTSLTTSGSAAITFDQTGAGGIGIDGPVTTGTGVVTLTSQQGISGTGLITTGGTLNVTAPSGLSIATAATTFGTLSVADGSAMITQTGALALPAIALASGRNLAIVATGAISQQTGTTLSVADGSASFTASTANADVILARANAFGGTINVSAGGTASVQIADTGTTSLGTLTLGTGTLTVATTGAITQTAAIVQPAGAGAVAFETDGAAITLTNPGNDFRGAVSATNTGTNDVAIVDTNAIKLGAMSVGGGLSVTSGSGTSITLGGDVSTTNGGQGYVGDLILDGGPRTLSADGGAIVIGGTIDSADGGNHGLTLTAVGDVTVTGAIGVSRPLGSLSITGNDIRLTDVGGVSAGLTGDAALIAVDADGGADPGSITLAGTVYRSSGAQSYTGPVTLAANATLTGTTPTFTGGVAGGGHDLALDFSGTTVITGAAFTGIRNLSTGNGGGTTLSGALTTTGTQTYGDAVTLAAHTTLNGTTPTFTNGVTGAGYDLALDFSGTTVIAGAGFTGIRNLSTGNGGGTTLSGAISTTGTQTYGDAVTLAASTTLDGTTPTFTNGVTGAGYDLALDFSGTTVITGAGFTGIRNLSTGNGGGTTLSGAISTTGTQTYGDAVTLANDTTLAGTTVTTSAAVTGGGRSLVITGNASVGGAISGVTSYKVSGTTSLGADVATTGTQDYTGLVTLTASVALSGTTPTFTAGVAGGSRNLTLNFSGTTTIVGSLFTNIAALTTDSTGSTTLSGTLATTGSQTFNDDVTLAAATTLDAGTGSIVLAGVVSGAFSLTPLTSGAGTTTLSGANTNAMTNVVSGVVILANSTPQTTAFVVSGGTLRGTGSIGSLTGTGTGTVSPGMSPGTIGASSLSLASGNTLAIEIAGTTAGSGYDQLVVAAGGTVSLGNATLGLAASFAPPADTVLTVIDNQGSQPVSGTFAGLAEGAIVTVDTQDYRISYVGGTGNDVTLTALQTDDIVVSVSGDNQVVLRLASKGVTISDLHTAYSAKANAVTITAVNDGTIFTKASGIQVNSASGTITVSLAAVPAFAGISIVGGNGNDSITLGPGGINLSAIAGGGASQSFRIDTGGGVSDTITVGRPVIAKGSGVVSLATSAVATIAGIRLSASVTTASGSQTYAGPVVLAADTSLATGLAGDVTFSSTLDGARVLTVASGGQVRFLGDVGVATPLRGVTVSKAAGVDVAGAFALSGVGAGSKADGLTIAAGVNNVVFADGYTGSGRLISGFGGSGVRLAGSSAASRLTGITSTKNGTGLRVDAGSYATTVIAGCSFNGNVNTGVSLTSARGLALGTAAAGNAIASNGSWGVFTTGNLTGTQVQNNSIDGNARFGVYLRAATGLQFGGTAPNTGNRVANTTGAGSYSTGLYATGKCTGTLVEGNTIRSNGGNGVMLVNAQRITIGGAATGAGNVIDLNGGFGVAASGTCTGSLVQGNTITGNARGAVNVRNAKGIRVV